MRAKKKVKYENAELFANAVFKNLLIVSVANSITVIKHLTRSDISQCFEQNLHRSSLWCHMEGVKRIQNSETQLIVTKREIPS